MAGPISTICGPRLHPDMSKCTSLLLAYKKAEIVSNRSIAADLYLPYSIVLNAIFKWVRLCVIVRALKISLIY